MSARRWLARWLPDPEPENPLAIGVFCDVCGARLDRPDRPCVFGPHDRRAA